MIKINAILCEKAGSVIVLIWKGCNLTDFLKLIKTCGNRNHFKNGVY